MSDKYPYKILVVEDEDLARENFVIYLEMFYDEVYEACDGEEALKIYKEVSPDIMLVDINIPKINGLDVIKKIREKNFTTKIIVLTAHTEKNFLIEAIGLKLTRYLFKPVNRKELKEAFEVAEIEMENFSISSNLLVYLKDEYTYNIDSKELKHHGDIVNITLKEQLLIEFLLKNKNRLCTYEEILTTIYDDDSTQESLKNLVKRVRKKLPKDTIINVSSQGYRINN